MENRDIAVLAFNVLNGLMICLAIGIAGLGTYVWKTEIPAVNTWLVEVVESQGLVSGLLGALASVLAWLGTFGVSNEKPKLVAAYAVVFGLLVMPTILLGVMTLVYMPKWMMTADDELYNWMEKYYNDTHSANITDGIQLEFRCCGMKPLPNSFREGAMLPNSCCDPLLFRVTEETSFCEGKYKFKRTCEGVLTEYLENAIKWLSSLVLLLAAFFMALLVDLHFVRRSSKNSIKKSKDASPSWTTASSKDTPWEEVSRREKKPETAIVKENLQKKA